jgi:predicted ATPase
MITEIYIDNFKCLTNFRIQPGDFQLWLGDNGSGKSSVFNALRNIQLIFQGKNVGDVFDASSLTAWDMRESQRFEVTMNLEDDIYLYHLTVEYSRQVKKVRIGREELKWNGAAFFLFDGRDAHLYRLHQGTGQPEEGTSFSADWSRSVIPTIAKREDNWPLLRFRDAVFSWLLINPIPKLVNPAAEAEARFLSEHAENFAEWYRYVLQENPGISYRAKTPLEKVLPGFEHVSLKGEEKSRRLTVTFRIADKDREFDFMALSDGQRQLILLYTVLEAQRAGVFSSLFIDEPDNFVSLREIQPWMGHLKDICDEESRQAVIISHHPEIINQMARGEELWFSRPQGAHVITKPLPPVADLPPSEIVARGWENE